MIIYLKRNFETGMRQVPHHNTDAGFTLIELMITVAIVGILAAIAIPSYEEFIRKGKRQEARSSILVALQQQERVLSQSNTYVKYDAGAASGAAAGLKDISGDTGRPSHLIGARLCSAPAGTTVVPPLASCVEVFAVPQSNDIQAGTIAMSSNGVKSCNGTQKDIPGICW